MVFAISVAVAVAVAVGIVLADADCRDDAFAFADVDDAHAARRPAHDADSVDWTADQGASVGHQHDLIARADGESRHDLATIGQAHEFDTFAAAPRDAVLK